MIGGCGLRDCSDEYLLLNHNNNNPPASITAEETTQPETGHFIGVALNTAASMQFLLESHSY